MSIISSNIIINASSDKVFQALTNPEIMKLWQFNWEVITNWKEGTEIKFRTKTEEKILEQWGTILEMKVNELIKYNLFTPKPGLEDEPESYCNTSYVLTNINGQTRVEVIQEDYRSESFMPVSLHPILASLKATVEKGFRD